MLVICGMVDNRYRPGFPLPRCSWSWSSSPEAFSGTFALSRSIFFEGWLLVELEKINGRTTLVPKFHSIGDNGEWKIELVTWKEHPYNADRSCGWKQIEHCEAGLEFVWKNRDEWTYDHQGDASDIHNGGYSVSCEIPFSTSVRLLAKKFPQVKPRIALFFPPSLVVGCAR
jgi:hypothetical protein